MLFGMLRELNQNSQVKPMPAVDAQTKKYALRMSQKGQIPHSRSYVNGCRQ